MKTESWYDATFNVQTTPGATNDDKVGTMHPLALDNSKR